VRPALFWLHLGVGLVSLTFVFVMSLTGLVLAFEKQVIAWADARTAALAPSTAARADVDRLLAVARTTTPAATPTALTISADPCAPAVVALGKEGAILIDTRRAEVIDAPADSLSARMRAFLQATTRLHRWLALDGDWRSFGKGVMGAANLAFLFLVLSGLYLWTGYRVAWFRGGLSGKARDFNWHCTIGFWMVLPLTTMIVSAVVISYSWASDLVYRFAGEAPPKKETPAKTAAPVPPTSPLEPLWAAAEKRLEGWRTISVKLPLDATGVTFTIDSGTGGQPQSRAQLTLDWSTAEKKWEPFEKLSPGRQLRSILRFAHTGEVAGYAGQALAGLASLGAAVLCLTALSLSWRRWRS
jgi:uncharacterized iron-regulated membrane protein